MNKTRLLSLVLFLWSLPFLAACSQEVPPATRAEITTPTPLPSPSPLPTVEPGVAATATLPASPTPTTSPTAEPATTPTATPAGAAALSLSINQPEDGTEVVAGNEISISGQARPIPEEELLLELEVVSRSIVAESVSVDSDSGTWASTLPIGQYVTGPARLLVSSAGGEATAEIHLEILPDEDANNPGLTLKRPGEHDTAVAGYSLFFGGRVRNPVNNMITISILVDDCTTVAASHTFSLTGGVWHGLLILPPNVTGPACAVAMTGSEADGEWREARIPIRILTSDNEEATSLTLGSPGENRTFEAGRVAEIFGVAVNAPDDRVHVVVSLDTAEGTVLAEGTARVDAFGYWEVELLLPEAITGPAVITASMGEGNHYVEFRASTSITP